MHKRLFLMLLRTYPQVLGKARIGLGLRAAKGASLRTLEDDLTG